MIDPVLDALRNAAASGRLLIVTGAGVSHALQRKDGSPLPSWGELLQSLRRQADPALLAPHAALLDELLPADADVLGKVHGDALIEAAEIMQGCFAPGQFEQATAELCREQAATCTETHRRIADLWPAGVITFNYDQGHEQAFRETGANAEAIRYDEAGKLKARLAEEHSGGPFILKAHGCTSEPPSLVLTSSSYRAVLSKNRTYRLFLQHCFVRYTVLIVGFALRDRDFDQLMSALEIELGIPHQTHAFIAKRPKASSPEGLVKRADWAAVTARFGLNSIFVDDFDRIPPLLESIGTQAGSIIEQLVDASASTDGPTRSAAHDQAIGLGRIGRAQMRSALLERLDRPGLDLAIRSEIIYAFRGIADNDARVPARLMKELERAANGASGPDAKADAECAAHALIVLRGLRIKDTKALKAAVGALKEPALLAKLNSLEAVCTIPRLQSYALAAAAELESRHAP